MADQNKTLFLNERRSDVHILVSNDNDTWKFPAHSLILCSGSQVLSSILEPLPYNENGFKELEITDLSPETIVNLLQYLYTGNLSIHDWEDATELLYAACKYQLRELIAECEGLVSDQLNLTNVCEIAERAQRLQLSSVEFKCVELMKLQAVIILNSASFLNLSRDTLTALLSSDELNVPDELTVVNALWKWGKRECCRLGKPLNDDEIGGVLADLLDHVRVEHIKEEICLPLCLRIRQKHKPVIIIKGKKDKHEERPAPCRKERILRAVDTFACSSCVCLVGLRCWEGVREMTEGSVLCAMLSSNRTIYISGFFLDIVEKNASGSCLYVSITDELDGVEIARQECRWIDSYDRRNQTVTELWHLSQTCLDVPVRLVAKRMYSIRLHSIGTGGDAFPYQALKQRGAQATDGVHLTLHAAELVALRKIHFVPIDGNDAWNC